MEPYEIAAAFAGELEGQRQAHESWELRDWPGSAPDRMHALILTVRGGLGSGGLGSGSWTVQLRADWFILENSLAPATLIRGRVQEAYAKLRAGLCT